MVSVCQGLVVFLFGLSALCLLAANFIAQGMFVEALSGNFLHTSHNWLKPGEQILVQLNQQSHISPLHASADNARLRHSAPQCLCLTMCEIRPTSRAFTLCNVYGVVHVPFFARLICITGTLLCFNVNIMLYLAFFPPCIFVV